MSDQNLGLLTESCKIVCAIEVYGPESFVIVDSTHFIECSEFSLALKYDTSKR